jgi:hypothetical protein
LVVNEKRYTLAQLAELLDKPLALLVMARSVLPLCPDQRDQHGRNLYGPRDISLLVRYLLENDRTALTETSEAARESYLAAVAPPGVDRQAALKAELARIEAGLVESTDLQETAILDAL